MVTEERENDTVVVQDEEGNEYECGIVGVYEIDGNKYVELFPFDEEDDEEGTIILRMKEEEGEEVLAEIEDEEEWNKVVQFIEEQGEDLEEEE